MNFNNLLDYNIKELADQTEVSSVTSQRVLWCSANSERLIGFWWATLLKYIIVFWWNFSLKCISVILPTHDSLNLWRTTPKGATPVN